MFPARSKAVCGQIVKLYIYKHMCKMNLESDLDLLHDLDLKCTSQHVTTNVPASYMDGSI